MILWAIQAQTEKKQLAYELGARNPVPMLYASERRAAMQLKRWLRFFKPSLLTSAKVVKVRLEVVEE